MASNPRKTPSQQAQKMAPKKRPQKTEARKKKLLQLAQVSQAHKQFKQLKGSPNLLALARSIMLPNNTSVPRPLPASAQAQVCTRIIRKNFVIGAQNLSADGRAAVVITPNLFGPAFILRPGSTLLPQAPAPFSIAGDFRSGLVKGATGLGEFKSGDGAQSALAEQQVINLAGDTRTAWDISFTSNTHITCVIKKAAQHNAYVRVRYYAGTGGAWGAGGVTQPLSSLGVDTQTVFTVPAGSRYFGFWFEDQNGNPILGDNTVKITAHFGVGDAGEAVQATLGGTVDHLFQEIPEYILDSNIETGCVNGVSVLVSNSSSELNKQGEIFAARVSPDILLEWSTIVDAIAALPDNRRYIGLAETGAYAWWMADSVSTCNPVPIAEYQAAIRKQESLIVYVKGLPATATFNVQIAWNVSFYTRNQLFEKIVTPPITDEWNAVYHALAQLPAASCNPEHESLFRSLAKRAFSAANGVYDHYQEHQKVYDGLVAILMSMLA